MDELEETFGSDFAEQYEEQIQERRRQRESVEESQKKQIAHKAVNENAFKQDNEPHFTHKSEEGVTNDVLLMMLPNPDNEPIWNRVNKLDSGAATCPLDYMGEWMSCLFNDPEDLKGMTPGEYYIIIGNMSQWENDAGEVFDQVSPVRGVMSLEEAREYASEALDESGINEPEPEPEPSEEVNEPEPEPEEEESPEPAFGGGSDDSGEEEEEESGDDDSGASFLGGDDEEEDEAEKVEATAIFNEVEELAHTDPEVWEVERDDPRLQKLAAVAAKRAGYDHEDDDVVERVAQYCIQRVEQEREEEEDGDDEEDNLF